MRLMLASFLVGALCLSPAAKAQAGLAMELDPENDQIRKWYERFE